MTFPRLRDAGDSMLILEFEPMVDPVVNARALATASALRAAALAGVRDVRATFRSVAVDYDALAVGRDEIAQAMLHAAADAVPIPSGREIEIPTVYGGEAGPDLSEVAARAGLRESEVIDLHAGRVYLAFMLGFVPGFPYLGPVADRIATPRRATPRLRVPAGTVGIAGRQTGIYPRVGPGGWALVGRTNVRLFDERVIPAALVQPGDRVRFVRVDHLDFTHTHDERAPEAAAADPALTVIGAGLLTTVQDLGRWGWQASGVPVGGAMDRAAFAEANQAVGNDWSAAALEATLAGLELRADRACVMAIAGGDLGATLDGRAVPMGTAVELRAGTTVHLAGRRAGTRAYLAFEGGVDVPPVLGSRSTELGSGFGGLGGRPLKAGDQLALGARRGAWGRPDGAAAVEPRGPAPGGGVRLRVLSGPHDDRLAPEAMAALHRTRFTVTPQSNRMGYRLHGAAPLLHADRSEMISDATVAGGIQVPPDGQPILLMADRQVTGGYPMLATVITADLPLAAQLAPGDWVEFEACTRAVAVTALRQGGWG